jgi:hypothetical protein
VSRRGLIGPDNVKRQRGGTTRLEGEAVVCLAVGGGLAEADVSVLDGVDGCLGGEGGLNDRMEP